eukprot:2115671-Pleurochrysis_carterae.AAC.1
MKSAFIPHSFTVYTTFLHPSHTMPRLHHIPSPTTLPFDAVVHSPTMNGLSPIVTIALRSNPALVKRRHP